MRNILLLAVASLMLASCGKYDEGPAVSFRSPEKRLAGLWEFSSINIDGVEYISDYFIYLTYLRLSISGTKEELFVVLVEDNQGSAPMSSSLLTLNSKCTELTFGLPVSPLYFDETENFYSLIPALAAENTWSIQRLAANEMWISTTFQEKPYALQLIKLDQYLLNP